MVVGLPDAAVKESKDRVSTALSNSGYKFPMGRTTINLAPADVKKEGPSFQLFRRRVKVFGQLSLEGRQVLCNVWMFSAILFCWQGASGISGALTGTVSDGRPKL